MQDDASVDPSAPDEPGEPEEDDLSIVSNLNVAITGNDSMCPSCCTMADSNNSAFGGTYAIADSTATGTTRIWQRQGCCGNNQILFQNTRWVMLDSAGECAAYPVAISETTDGTVNPWNLAWSVCNGETGAVYTTATMTISLQN